MRIGTVDAVTGNIITATLSLEARGTPVKGGYVTISCDEDQLLGRVTSVDLTNMIHKDPTFAPYIMQHGSVPNWSGEVDIECAKIELLRAVDGDGKFCPIRRNPPSGTSINSVAAKDFMRFYNESEHLLAVGFIPNSGDLLAQIINRSFGNVEEGGYGEARHIVVLGQNGSGKTVLATMLVAGRLAANPNMGLLMPDTAGDLLNPASHSRGEFLWNYQTVLDEANIRLERLSINDIRLTSRRTLRDKLAPILKNYLTTTPDKAQEMARHVVDAIISGQKVTLGEFTANHVLDAVIDAIPMVWAQKASRDQKLNDMARLKAHPNLLGHYQRDIEEVRRLFDGREEIGLLVDAVLRDGRKVLLDVHSRMSRSDQELVMRELMSQLGWRAGEIFRERGERACNALIVLDEGMHWVPQQKGDDDSIGSIIREKFRETRKYGVGWMVIAQSPAGIHNDILRESHTKYFGRNLGVGADEAHLKEALGQQGYEAYQQLEMQGGYFFMGCGHDNNIGSAATYFAFHTFSGDATNAFIQANPGIFNELVRNQFAWT